MLEKEVVVRNRAGMHARPAALIAQTANKYASEISIIRDRGGANETIVNAKSIMGVITMAAGYNTLLILVADGPDEGEAIIALHSLFESKFEED